ncbi:ThuA domain-containing protein [Flavihumibacter fluvii]|uniref:ThuA domain-containing protein n=1 Tax=Flavihumibacter fluvii TaxID=2838157 RepID=UPI001BDF36BE|nr:ThuA domain-containing protein [Flavihumibacter fluvii]ULQ50718.1 ThuA domain-containing protein [Flavihumibacter fluvii]
MIQICRQLCFVFCLVIITCAFTQEAKPKFSVIAFFTAKNDAAHISYVHEANRWFPEMAVKYQFRYDSTNDWNNLNKDFLSKYQVVLFLDSRPENATQRKAFRQYMESGGAWMGFHFAGFALTPSAFNQDWDWYHNELIGAGQYKGNTWRPTSAILRIENPKHPVTRHLPVTFRSSPNEWYSWEKDLAQNKDIEILLAIDSTSFPLGTGPKLHEIWHAGYYPVVWTNRKYRMLYLNMGHNDIDYENGTNQELSFQFDNDIQNKLVIDGLFWLAKKTTKQN